MYSFEGQSLIEKIEAAPDLKQRVIAICQSEQSPPIWLRKMILEDGVKLVPSFMAGEFLTLIRNRAKDGPVGRMWEEIADHFHQFVKSSYRGFVDLVGLDVWREKDTGRWILPDGLSCGLGDHPKPPQWIDVAGGQYDLFAIVKTDPEGHHLALYRLRGSHVGVIDMAKAVVPQR